MKDSSSPIPPATDLSRSDAPRRIMQQRVVVKGRDLRHAWMGLGLLATVATIAILKGSEHEERSRQQIEGR